MSLINWYRAITQCTQCCSVKSTGLAATCAVYIWQVRKLSREGRSRNRSYAVYAPCYTVTEEATLRECKNNVMWFMLFLHVKLAPILLWGLSTRT